MPRVPSLAWAATKSGDRARLYDGVDTQRDGHDHDDGSDEGDDDDDPGQPLALGILRFLRRDDHLFSARGDSAVDGGGP